MRKKFSILLTGIILLGAILTATGCSSLKDEGFAIYYTENDIPPAKMDMQSHVNIAEEPLIAESDIIGYNAETHEIELTSTALERIGGIGVPMGGKSFVVCVDRAPIYWGAFMTHLSSFLFPGITIYKPMSSERTITISLGFLSQDEYRGDDPRNDLTIMESLRKSGKLVNETTTTMIDVLLPHSMKGYELYSWQENNEWQFRLITGTNRNKTYDEIINDPTTITDWASIHVSGIDAVESLIGKLPENEFVAWTDRIQDDSGKEEIFTIKLPEESEIERIKNRAEKCGVELVVPSFR